MRKFYPLLLFLMIYSLTGSAQQVDKGQVIDMLREIRTELSGVHPASEDLKNQVSGCKQLINEAIINVDSRDLTYSQPYVASLIAVKLLAAKLPNADDAIQSQIIDIIAKDLQLKFRQPPNSIVDQGYTQFVDVTVITRGQNNLRVNYTALGYEVNYQKPEHQFQRLTSPTKEQMVPGIYEMWITANSGGPVLKHQLVEIDPNKSDHTIDF